MVTTTIDSRSTILEHQNNKDESAISNKVEKLIESTIVIDNDDGEVPIMKTDGIFKISLKTTQYAISDTTSEKIKTGSRDQGFQ